MWNYTETRCYFTLFFLFFFLHFLFNLNLFELSLSAMQCIWPYDGIDSLIIIEWQSPKEQLIFIASSYNKLTFIGYIFHVTNWCVTLVRQFLFLILVYVCFDDNKLYNSAHMHTIVFEYEFCNKFAHWRQHCNIIVYHRSYLLEYFSTEYWINSHRNVN